MALLVFNTNQSLIFASWANGHKTIKEQTPIQNVKAVLDEGSPSGLPGGLQQGHSHLLQGSISFPEVTGYAGADHILPAVPAASGDWDDVVEI